ncbi:MAG: FxsA family protein [Alphaproteobacteria bacterium]
MALFLLLAFIIVPVVEIAVIIKIGGILGVWPTVGLIVLSAAAGTAMVRAQGFQILTRAQETLGRGQFPAEELFDGLSLMVAGVLLLTPGFVTDTLGLALLIPPVRRWLAVLAWRALLQSSHVHVSGGWQGTGRGSGPDDGTIEGEFVEIPPERLPRDDRDDPRRP